MLVAIGAAILEISIPQMLRFIVDELVQNTTEAGVWIGGGLVLLIGVGNASLAYWRRWLIVDPTSTLEIRMRMNFFDRILRAPLSVLDRWSSGQLLTRSMSDLSTIRRWLSFALVQMTSVVVMFVTGGYFMVTASAPLAVIFGVAIPVLVLSLISYVRKYEAYTREIQRLTSDLSTRIEESVRGIRVVKALGRSPEQITEYTRDAEHLNEVEHRRAMLVARVGFYQRVIVGAVTMLALLVGAPQVASGSLSLGAMTAYFAVLTVVLGHVLRSTALMASYLNYRVAFERHVEVMSDPGDEQVRLVEEETVAYPSGGAISVACEAVSFSYAEQANTVDSDTGSEARAHEDSAENQARTAEVPEEHSGQDGASTDHAEQSGLGGFLAKILGFAKDSQDHQDSAGSAQEADPDPAAFPELQADMQEPSPEPTEQEREFARAQQKAATSKTPSVLHDITFKAFAGEILALVGATGSGKSTILNLIPRFYEPSSGKILLGGHDAADMPLPEVRAQMASVFEEAVLFSGSVCENVLLGVHDLSSSEEADQRVRAALTIAACDFVDDLPEGVNTIIGEEGLSLSGGQRQRLSLARALAVRPSVLLLDDPFSALDVHTEEKIIEALRTGHEGLGGATTLLTAHRPSTVALADRVLLLEGGRITAQGTHTELMKLPQYRRLMSVQDED
ncbi:ABC transporter ATP-binding protein/permease [Rothia dentocariosa]|nr:ABC transporter ATP-binding protein [Rothia dentocariosa]MCM3437825.1 ABC transporter ATP-binding protein/permease [Rothia dentocariosa]